MLKGDTILLNRNLKLDAQESFKAPGTTLPFIQWQFNTQVCQVHGGKSPYHKAFGQNSQVGLSNFPISKELFSKLAKEMDVNHIVGPECVHLDKADLKFLVHVNFYQVSMITLMRLDQSQKS